MNSFYNKTNTIYEKNIESLKNRFDSFYENHKILIESFKLQANLKSYEEKKQLEIVKAKNGNLTASFEGSLLHSSYNPEAEANKMLLTENIKEHEIAVFLGFGLGYAPLAFCKNYPEKTLILIEPEIERALWAFSHIDFSSLFVQKKLIFLIAADPKDCIHVLEHFGIDQASFIKSESHALHQKEYFLRLSELIERNKQKKEINDSTLERFGKLWLKNTIKNAPQYEKLKGISALKNIHQGKKALILAAGPSLDKILEYLPELSKKMIVICVDTALDACLRAGLSPDYLITIDPQYWNAMHIRHLESPETILITEISSYPSVFRFSCKDIYLTESIYPIGSLIEKKFKEKGFPELGALKPGGSVATTAWELSLYLGCDSIYFAGLDLSFPHKITHSKGSLFEKKAHYDENRLMPSESLSAKALYSAPSLCKKNYKGEDIHSDIRMELYAWWFESNIEKHGVKTYVLSNEGMYIPGIEFIEPSLLLKEKNILSKNIQSKNILPKKSKNQNNKTKIKELVGEKYQIFQIIKNEIKEEINFDLKYTKEILEIPIEFYLSKNKIQLLEHLENIKTKFSQRSLKHILPLAGKSDRQIIAKAKKRSQEDNLNYSLAYFLCFFENAKDALEYLNDLLSK